MEAAWDRPYGKLASSWLAEEEHWRSATYTKSETLPQNRKHYHYLGNTTSETLPALSASALLDPFPKCAELPLKQQRFPLPNIFPIQL